MGIIDGVISTTTATLGVINTSTSDAVSYWFDVQDQYRANLDAQRQQVRGGYWQVIDENPKQKRGHELEN